MTRLAGRVSASRKAWRTRKAMAAARTPIAVVELRQADGVVGWWVQPGALPLAGPYGTLTECVAMADRNGWRLVYLAQP